jgi:hypothetical protein
MTARAEISGRLLFNGFTARDYFWSSPQGTPACVTDSVASTDRIGHMYVCSKPQPGAPKRGTPGNRPRRHHLRSGSSRCCRRR